MYIGAELVATNRNCNPTPVIPKARSKGPSSARLLVKLQGKLELTDISFHNVGFNLRTSRTVRVDDVHTLYNWRTHAREALPSVHNGTTLLGQPQDRSFRHLNQHTSMMCSYSAAGEIFRLRGSC